MVEFVLTNPLTLEERLSVVRLIEHDVGKYYDELGGSSGHYESDNLLKRRLRAIVKHLRHTNGTIYCLSQDEGLILGSHQGWSLNTSESREHFIIDLNDLFPGSLPSCDHGYRDTKPGTLQTIGFSFAPSFLGHEPILHSILFNLIKNGLATSGGRRVFMNIRGLNKFPENALYIPEGARNYNNFVVFDIINSGAFSSRKPFTECLTSTPDIREHGFGLYFVGLASKVFRAPVSMKTEEGQTQISFYHPVYYSQP